MNNTYYMPPEWSEHKSCWMAWPTDEIAWRGRHKEAKKVVCKLANIISEYEIVNFIVPPQYADFAARIM